MPNHHFPPTIIVSLSSSDSPFRDLQEDRFYTTECEVSGLGLSHHTSLLGVWDSFLVNGEPGHAGESKKGLGYSLAAP